MGSMGSEPNFPAQYLDARLGSVAEVALLALFVVVMAGWWWTRRSVSPAAAPPVGLRWWERFEAGPPGRTLLQVGIGALWVIDGLLQAQSSMPRQFVPMVIEPALTGQPAWIVHLGRFAVNLWSLHTVSTDAFTVFVQVAIGLALIFGGDSIMAKCGLGVSIVWGLSVWVFGEAMGGIFGRPATFLSGAPGAVLVYVVAAVVLLAIPPRRWSDQSVGRTAGSAVGGLLVATACLQALPWEGFWRAGTLSAVFVNAASNSQPSLLSAPITAVAHLARAHPDPVNAVFVLVPAVLGIWLLARRRERSALAATAVWLFVTWWLGMDFGVVGGVGPDPNIAVPVGIFVAVAWIGLMSRLSVQEQAKEIAPESGAASAGEPDRTVPWLLGHPVRTWLAGAMAAATLWTVVPVLRSVPKAVRTPSGVTLAYVSSGGMSTIPGHRAAPGFSLVNQDGRPTSLASFRGKVVLLTFLDPVCSGTCPVVAQEMAEAATLLAQRQAQVELVAINANPDFTAPATLADFDTEHDIGHLANWDFLTGSPATLRQVYRSYGALSQTFQAGMVAHSELLYVIGPDGRERSLTTAGGIAGLRIEDAYAEMLADAASQLVPRG